MQVTTLSFENMHNHGELFANMLRARHKTFIEHKNWDLPQADGMEYDPYATPESRWVAVHEFGQVLAGVRLTPTTARCGIYSYMIRDAQNGLLDSLPTEVFTADDSLGHIRMSTESGEGAAEQLSPQLGVEPVYKQTHFTQRLLS